MARVVAFIPDLLFGSAVLSSLQAAGHQVELRGDLDSGVEDADLFVVDLTVEPEERIERARGVGAGIPKLAFYSHVEPEVRASAEAAGFDLVVPRSRMAREGAALADGLLAGG
jgi:hypothetical protein